MTNSLTHNHTDDRSELLSGYLDRALDVTDYRKAEQTLRECAACVAELGELRAVQSLLRELPAPVPRRSFTIDPATVRPRRLWFPVFRFASLAAAMLLIVVLGVDALAMGGGQSMATMSKQSAESQAAPAAGGAEAPMADAPLSLESANEATTEAPAAALLAPTTATEALEAPAAEAPAAAGTSAPEAAAAAPAPLATEETYDAAGADAEATGQSFDMMEATAASALVSPQDTAVADGDVGDAPETLRQSDNAAGETETLDAPAPQPVAPPLDLWRLAAYVLALLMLAFGGAWWWTARRGI